MASHQSKAQKGTVSRVMHEFKHGELETSRGRKVRNPKQAIAIGLREAGVSKYESNEKNRENLKRTKARERRGTTEKDRSERTDDGQTRAELYAEARRRNISGTFEDEQKTTRTRFALVTNSCRWADHREISP